MNRKTLDFNLGFDKTNKLINYGFTSKFGPGDLPIEKRNKKITGIIAPNYHYKASTSALAWAYKEIAESRIPDVYLILGRDLLGKNKFSTFMFSDWETSFGSVIVDGAFGNSLMKCFSLIKNSYDAFENNYTIDIQLPFLQFANRGSLDKIRFLPVLIGNVSHKEICEFADVVTDIQKNIYVICSSNLTYYGKEYNYVPFLHGIKQNIYAKDSQLLSFMSRLDVKRFLDTTKRGAFLDRNVIALFMELMRGFGLRKGKILSYYTSGDIEGYENSVSFGVVVF